MQVQLLSVHKRPKLSLHSKGSIHNELSDVHKNFYLYLRNA